MTRARHPCGCVSTEREWLVIEDSMSKAVFATKEQEIPKGYIPRDVAEGLLGRSMEGIVWFSAEEGRLMRAHPEWRRELP